MMKFQVSASLAALGGRPHRTDGLLCRVRTSLPVRRLAPTLFIFLSLPGLVGCGQLMTPVPGATVTPVPTNTRIAVIPTVTPRPTATPKPATPAPTHTATVTPTPVIYVVQAGDTLLGVALKYDVPAQLIQETNGIVDPRSLQIGQELVIPDPDQDTEPLPTSTPTPPALAVSGVSFHETPLGSLWCLGEVNNTSGLDLSEVVVEASLFDAQGTLLAAASAFTQLNVVPSGEKVPFAILFDKPPPRFAQFQVRAVAAVPLAPQTRYYLDLAALELSGAPQGAATYRINGQLKNVGQEDVESIRLVVVAYSEDARVLAERQADLEVELLRAGAVTPFAIDLQIAGGTVARYEVRAQGLRAP